MAYGVEIARNAQADLEELYLWVVSARPISTASSERCSRWTDIRSAVRHRSGPADSGAQLRTQASRVSAFFTVDHIAKVVRVVHVRRGGAKQRPTADDLRGEESMVGPLPSKS